MMRSFLALLTIIAFSVAARAGDQAPQPKVSITISPFHFVNPYLQVTGELRLADKIGAAAIVGGGMVSEENKSYGAWEVGGQFRYYLLGSFTHGLMLGADIGYMHIAGQLDNPMDYFVGVRAGAFAGYKIATKRGFTFDVQFGPQYVRESADNAEWQTLTNLKVGWSF
ncbi:MAG: hypothetical protein ABIF71_04600 [Planctomycetota bacterium]